MTMIASLVIFSIAAGIVGVFVPAWIEGMINGTDLDMITIHLRGMVYFVHFYQIVVFGLWLSKHLLFGYQGRRRLYCCR